MCQVCFILHLFLWYWYPPAEVFCAERSFLSNQWLTRSGNASKVRETVNWMWNLSLIGCTPASWLLLLFITAYHRVPKWQVKVTSRLQSCWNPGHRDIPGSPPSPYHTQKQSCWLMIARPGRRKRSSDGWFPWGLVSLVVCSLWPSKRILKMTW